MVHYPPTSTHPIGTTFTTHSHEGGQACATVEELSNWGISRVSTPEQKNGEAPDLRKLSEMHRAA